MNTSGSFYGYDKKYYDITKSRGISSPAAFLPIQFQMQVPNVRPLQALKENHKLPGR